MVDCELRGPPVYEINTRYVSLSRSCILKLEELYEYFNNKHVVFVNSYSNRYPKNV